MLLLEFNWLFPMEGSLNRLWMLLRLRRERSSWRIVLVYPRPNLLCWCRDLKVNLSMVSNCFVLGLHARLLVLDIWSVSNMFLLDSFDSAILSVLNLSFWSHLNISYSNVMLKALSVMPSNSRMSSRDFTSKSSKELDKSAFNLNLVLLTFSSLTFFIIESLRLFFRRSVNSLLSSGYSSG